MDKYIIPTLPLTFDVETKVVLKQAAVAHRRLAELKGAIKSMPNASILINTLALQESKDSSEIESIITTHMSCIKLKYLHLYLLLRQQKKWKITTLHYFWGMIK